MHPAPQHSSPSWGLPEPTTPMGHVHGGPSHGATAERHRGLRPCPAAGALRSRPGGCRDTYHLVVVVAVGDVGLLEKGAEGRLWEERPKLNYPQPPRPAMALHRPRPQDLWGLVWPGNQGGEMSGSSVSVTNQCVPPPKAVPDSQADLAGGEDPHTARVQPAGPSRRHSDLRRGAGSTPSRSPRQRPLAEVRLYFERF